MISLDYKLKTDRLTLRTRNVKDNVMIFSATQFEGFNDGMPWNPPESVDELLPKIKLAEDLWLSGNSYTFVIVKSPDNISMGLITIRKEDSIGTWSIGYFLHPDYQRMGYMTEAVKEIINFGFKKLKAKIIEAQCAVWNTASEKILEASGMKFVEIIPQGFMKNGLWVEEKKYHIETLY